MFKKLFLFIAALTLVAQQVSAKDDVEFSYKGVFSIEPGKAVVFATTNCKNTGVDTERFQWKEDGRYSDGQDYILSSDEWTYLIVTRDKDKEQRDALGTVKGEKGLILLPDDWVQPEDVSELQSATSYDQNVYNEDQWWWMEEAGAIFLPCQGYAFDEEDQHIVENENNHGVYWARDDYSGSNANCMRFEDGTAPNMSNSSKQNYYSVRLVRDVTVFDENDSQAQFAEKLAYRYNHQDEFDEYVFVRRYLLHNGYFNTICLPFEVEVPYSPLKDAEVFTVTSGTVVDGCLQVNIAPLEVDPVVLLPKMRRGVPYLIRWTKDTEVVPLLAFYRILRENWVESATDASTTGDDVMTYQGFFGMTHIEDKTNGEDKHYNFFLYNNNELCWPTDGNEPTAMMKGFRAYFWLTPSESSAAPRYRGMPAKLQETSITDDATRLNQPSATPNCQKVFDADKVVIILDGKKYSIGGQEL